MILYTLWGVKMELRVAQLRKRKGMTQKQLAELCATTQQQIAKIEVGTGDPQLSTLTRIARALGGEVKDLFYSRKEFLAEILGVVRREKIDLKKVSILGLNSLCAEAAGMPPLHPYWEWVEIKNNKVFLKEDA